MKCELPAPSGVMGNRPRILPVAVDYAMLLIERCGQHTHPSSSVMYQAQQASDTLKKFDL